MSFIERICFVVCQSDVNSFKLFYLYSIFKRIGNRMFGYLSMVIKDSFPLRKKFRFLRNGLSEFKTVESRNEVLFKLRGFFHQRFYQCFLWSESLIAIGNCGANFSNIAWCNVRPIPVCQQDASLFFLIQIFLSRTMAYYIYTA